MYVQPHIIIIGVLVLAYFLLRHWVKRHLQSCISWCVSSDSDTESLVWAAQHELELESQYKLTNQDKKELQEILHTYRQHMKDKYFKIDWNADINEKILKVSHEEYFWGTLFEYLRSNWQISSKYGIVYHKLFLITILAATKCEVVTGAKWRIQVEKESIDAAK